MSQEALNGMKMIYWGNNTIPCF